MSMVNDPTFQNVAGRMLTGHYAYKRSVRLCLDKQQASDTEGWQECTADLHDVIQGACFLNFVTMW